jgi:hypothetical protein
MVELGFFKTRFLVEFFRCWKTKKNKTKNKWNAGDALVAPPCALARLLLSNITAVSFVPYSRANKILFCVLADLSLPFMQ